MRKAIFSLLVNDPVLRSYGFNPENIMGAGGVDSPEMRPFIIVKYGFEQHSFGLTGSTELQVWAYDESKSYEFINLVLDRVDEILCENADIVVEDSRYGTNRPNGRSDELYDDIFKCVTKYTTHDITGGRNGS